MADAQPNNLGEDGPWPDFFVHSDGLDGCTVQCSDKMTKLGLWERRIDWIFDPLRSLLHDPDLHVARPDLSPQEQQVSECPARLKHQRESIKRKLRAILSGQNVQNGRPGGPIPNAHQFGGRVCSITYSLC
jgi:hypothetical protein